MAERIAYLTGTDANRMLNTGILVDSFRQHMPGERLFVCDFGLSANERQFWQAAGNVLAMPDQLSGYGHAWYRKAAISAYLEPHQFDAIVWLDADMILLRSISQDVAELVQRMKVDGLSVAATTDASGYSIGQFIAAAEAAGSNVTPFAPMLETYGADVNADYLNSGFFIIPDMNFARRWQAETLAQGQWLLFEQNAFNAVSRAPEHRVLQLDPAVWNVHGDLLANVDIGVEPSAAILHTTSAEQRHHIENEIRYPIGDLVLPGWFKLFVRDDLRAIQQTHLFSFLQAHLEKLAKFELLKSA